MSNQNHSIEEEKKKLLELIEKHVDTEIIERIDMVEKLIFPEPDEKLEVVTSCEGSGVCQDEMISSTKS